MAPTWWDGIHGSGFGTRDIATSGPQWNTKRRRVEANGGNKPSSIDLVLECGYCCWTVCLIFSHFDMVGPYFSSVPTGPRWLLDQVLSWMVLFLLRNGWKNWVKSVFLGWIFCLVGR